MNKIDGYVNEVLSYIIADNNMKARIRDDLTSQLNESAATEDIDEVIHRMGEPKEVAREFMDSMYEDKGELFDEIISKHPDKAVFMKRVYEFKSRASLFGIPLVHIKFNRYGKPTVAKGILAIGTVSVGFISIGTIPLGVICLGGLPVGIIALGGISIGLLLAIGGIAVGAAAIGGVAIGNIAVGGYAKGIVAIGDRTFGDYVLTTNHLGPETSEKVSALVRSAFPNLPDWIIDILSGITADLGSSR